MTKLRSINPIFYFILIILMIPLSAFGSEANTASATIQWPTHNDGSRPSGVNWGGESNKTLHGNLAAESRAKNAEGSILEYKSTTLWGTVLDFAFHEEYMIVLSINGLQIFLHDDRTTPIAHLPIPVGNLFDQFELRDKMLFVARSNELHVVDITDILAPVTLSVTTFELAVRDIVIEGDRLYIGLNILPGGAPDATFKVLDISNPSTPSLIGTLMDSHQDVDVWDIMVVDSFAYTIGNDFGGYFLKVISLINESSPTLVSYPFMGSAAFDMARHGDFMYMARDDGIAVYDNSSPASPQQVYLVGNGGGNWTCTLDGDNLFVRTYGGIEVYDITEASLPLLVNTIAANPDWWDVWFGGNVDGSLLHAPQFRNGFEVFDISNPLSVTSVADYKCPSWISSGLAMGDQHCYISQVSPGGGWGHALHVLDISDPGDPQYISSFSAGAQSPRATLSGAKLGVSTGGTGLFLYDISDPVQPTYIDKLANAGYHAFMTPDLAFVCASGISYDIYDISNVLSPQFLASAHADRFSAASCVEGDIAYLFEYDLYWSGPTTPTYLRVIDVADPTNPQTLNEIVVGEGDSRPSIATKVGNYLFEAQSDSGLIIIDVSDPSLPFVAASYLPMGTEIFDLCSFGDYLFVSIANPPIVEVLDISTPLAPVSVEYALYPSPVKEIYADGRHLYAATEIGFYVHTINMPMVCGDVDYSGDGPDISDLVYLVDFMFTGGPAPVSPESGDVDGSGGPIDIADLVYLVDFMFNGGPAPACL